MGGKRKDGQIEGCGSRSAKRQGGVGLWLLLVGPGNATKCECLPLQSLISDVRGAERWEGGSLGDPESWVFERGELNDGERGQDVDLAESDEYTASSAWYSFRS
jgi:hypothetical protein